jgi:glycine/D-amino acid oxidase-like deaminating enzyme
MANPYNYLRVDEMAGQKDRLMVGGADHRSELKMPADKNYKALKEYMSHLSPNLSARVLRKWRGGILESSDGLPLIGETAPRRYVATAFSGNGMTYAALAGWISSSGTVCGTRPV